MELPDVSDWSHQFDATSAECLIFIFKEGMLSAVAHDLKLRVEEFELALDQSSRAVAAVFNPESVRVVNAMRDGRDDPSALSEENKKQIDLNIRLEVLKARQFPDIIFISERVTDIGNGFLVQGQLTLHETSTLLAVPVRRDKDHYIAEVKVHQPDFGITPYSAMMGAIRVKPTVLVRLSLPSA